MSSQKKFGLFLIYCGLAWVLFWIVKLPLTDWDVGASTRTSTILTSILYICGGFVPIVFGFVVKALDSELKEEGSSKESNDEPISNDVR